MTESLSDDEIRRPTKRRKVIGCVSWGNAPTEIRKEDKTETIIFDIHNFADQEHKRGEFLLTKSIEVNGHSWGLCVFPRGAESSDNDDEYVSIDLVYSGLSMVFAKVMIRTKSEELESDFAKFSIFTNYCWGFDNYSTRNNIIRKDLTKDGTLTIRVEITMATGKPTVWFPTVNNSLNNGIEKGIDTSDRDLFKATCKKDIGSNLYRSIEKTYDVTLLVGPSRKEIHAHRAVLAIKARDLFELIETEEESASSSTLTKDTGIVLPDVNTEAFEILIWFCYSESAPLSQTGDETDAKNEAKAKNLLVVADRFGCTALKLWVESSFLHRFLAPSNAARLLLLADSYSCPMLKEASMNIYIANSKAVQKSKSDWNNLKESSKLLVELLDYSMSPRKVYSSVVVNGDGTINDADEFDVSSLRERLEKYDLDVDGSQEILLKRWKDHLLSHISSVDG